MVEGRLLAVLMLFAAAPSAAQVRVGAAVEAPPIHPIPAVAMGRGGVSQASLPLMSLSLSPSLCVPAVSPNMSAVVPPILAHPADAAIVQTPLPLSLTHVVQPTADSNGVRAQVAESVVLWQTSRSALPAAKTSASASPVVANPPIPLDALFDGSLPASREVLSRAESRGLTPAALARALSTSKSPSDAAAHLLALGVLGSNESSLAASNEAEFRFLLTRLWRKTIHSLPVDFKVDATFGVPALRVERDGVTYFVHAVGHGQYGAPRRSAVLSMVRRIEAAGHALYSEQHLPAYYGYKAGFETLDHAVSAMPSVVPAAPDYTRATLLLKRAIGWAVAPGGALATLGWIIAAPTSALAWILLPVLGTLAWLVLTGGLPLMRWKRRRLASGARAEGLEDIAEQYADEAANFFVAVPDLEVLRGLELPQPLGATDDTLSLRSRAIADAVAADVVARGASAVHLVVGTLHAREVAWRLAEGPRMEVPGSQIY